MPFPTKRSNKSYTPASNARSLAIYIYSNTPPRR